MAGGGRIEQKEAQTSCMYGGVKLCEMSKSMGKDTLIHVHGTGCGRGGPLYEEDFACGRRRRNIDQEVLAQ